MQLFSLYFTLIGIFVGTVFSGVKAQENPAQLADQLYENGFYRQAIDQYKTALKQKNTRGLEFRLAHAYRQYRNYDKALQHYEAVLKDSASKYPEARFWKARMLKAAEDYQAARSAFQSFQNNYEGDQDQLVDWSKQEIKNCNKARQWHQNPADKKLSLLTGSINQQHSSNAPMLNEDKMWFTGTTQKEVDLTEISDLETDEFETTLYLNRLYISKPQGKEWSSGKLVEVDMEDDHSHVRSPALSTSKKYIYYSLCGVKEGAEEQCNIYSAAPDGSDLSDSRKSPSPMNEEESSTKHPHWTQIDDKKILIFSSNRSGGEGGYDLWYIAVEGGNISDPTNLGPDVNTPADEVSPYYDSENNVLYFSSEGHTNMGGFDVFRTEGKFDRGWTKAENLKYPVNTGADDYYFFKTPGEQKGYLASNRQGDHCCDKIFGVNMNYDRPEQMSKAGKKSDKTEEDTLASKKDSAEKDTSQKESSAGSKTAMAEETESKETKETEKETEKKKETQETKSTETKSEETSEEATKEDKEKETKVEMEAVTTDPEKKKEAGTQQKGSAREGEPSTASAREIFHDLLQNYGGRTHESLVFKVQLGAYRTPEDQMFTMYKKFGTLSQYQHKGLTKYVIGERQTLKGANELQKEIRKAGIQDAFMVPFYQGDRISFQEAIQLLKKSGQ